MIQAHSLLYAHARPTLYLHFQSPINVGMVVSPNNMLCTLSSKVNDDNVIIEALVSVTQRPFIKVGDSTEIVLAGVMQSEFGTLKGKIVEIDSDNTIDSQNGTAYFKVKIKPTATVLKAKDGRVVTVYNGLMAESRITFNQTTWLKYFLKQIGILDK